MKVTAPSRCALGDASCVVFCNAIGCCRIGEVDNSRVEAHVTTTHERRDWLVRWWCSESKQERSWEGGRWWVEVGTWRER
jgi:hypothetical protein